MNPMRKFIIVTFFSGCFFLAGHLLPLIFVDPLNISQAELTDNEFYIREMRFQSAGIINKLDFDSVIIGSSMAENFLPQTAADILGGKFVNLSLSGSLLSERKVVLDHLFRKKKISKVLISLDGITNIQRNRGIPLDSWSYLYNDSYYDDFTVYLTRKFSPYLSCHSVLKKPISNFIFGNCPNEKIRNNVENLTEWQSDPDQNSRFGGVDSWVKHKKNQQIDASIKKINRSIVKTAERTEAYTKQSERIIYDIDEFIENISPLILEQSNTQFILFFPPYSVYHHAVTKELEPNIYNQYLDVVKSLVAEVSQYPNADIYWFQDEGFSNDIENYKDLTHYHQNISNLLLRNISQGRSKMTNENHLDLLNEFETQVSNVDLMTLANALNKIN